MNESEQAQANKINSIRHRVNDWKNHLEKNSLDLPIGTLDSLSLIEIVDSQAQKIADLNRVGSNTLLALIEAQEKIAEQAKEIERLKQRIQDEYDAKAGF